MLNLFLFIIIFVGSVVFYILPPMMCGGFRTTRVVRIACAVAAFALPVFVAYCLEGAEFLPRPIPSTPRAMEAHWFNELLLHIAIGFSVTWLAVFRVKKYLVTRAAK